jgi:transposase
MPQSTFVEIPPEAHAQMLAALRRARYGYLLALQILLLCAAGRPPTAIAAVLFCSRASVYRTLRAYRQGTLGWDHDAPGRLLPPMRTTVLLPTLRRSLVARLKAIPQAHGWCRMRRSCATRAPTLQAKWGVVVSAETMRRWLHELGWVWKRANLVATDDDPHRVERLARIRFVYERVRLWEAMVFADELAIHLLPKVGSAWMPKGTQVESMTPGTNAKPSLAGALDLAPGTLPHCVGPRKTTGLFRDLLQTLEATDPAAQYQRLSVVVDHDKIHQAKAVEDWLVNHPRMTRLLLPTYCPRAKPIERAFGDVHDLCTRNHTRTRLPALGADVEDHLDLNGPWKYTLSDLSYAPAITAAVEQIAAEEHAKGAA